MSKQTLEEAAQQWVIDHENDGISWGMGTFHSFESGAAWQKEQGIDWISINESLPQIPKDKKFLLVLYSNRESVGVCDFKYGKFMVHPFRVTHWAYINLPKTDK